MNVNITDPIFHNEAAAERHIELSRWPDDEPVCPHCGSTHVTRMGGKTQAGMFLCNDCRDKFTVRTGTVMERSHVPLHKWLLATHLLASSKKGISASQIARNIGVTYKTAWFLCHRIREAMNQPSGPLGGDPKRVVEADETFVGGKTRNRKSKKVADKKIVVTLVERGGHARSFHVANIHAATLRPLLFQNADRLSTLMTDEMIGYKKVGEQFWQHQTVNHSALEYARGNWHTNTAENFFSIFKRGVIGTYHHLSAAHMHRYCAEFDFRYNTRQMTDGERASLALKGMEGKRLTYRRPVALAA